MNSSFPVNEKFQVYVIDLGKVSHPDPTHRIFLSQTAKLITLEI